MDRRVLPEPGAGRPKRHEVFDRFDELSDDLDLIASLGLTVTAWEGLPDSEQEWWRTRQQRRRLTHECGHPRDVCADPQRQWFPQLEVCYVTRERDAAEAAYERLHEKRPWHNGDMTSWAEKPDDEHPYHFKHGAKVWASEVDHGLGGAFTTQENPWESLEDRGLSPEAE